jgi:hypothetical protein
MGQQHSCDLELARADRMMQSRLASFALDVAINPRLEKQPDGVRVAPRYGCEKRRAAKGPNGLDRWSPLMAAKFDNCPDSVQYIIDSFVFAQSTPPNPFWVKADFTVIRPLEPDPG